MIGLYAKRSLSTLHSREELKGINGSQTFDSSCKTKTIRISDIIYYIYITI